MTERTAAQDTPDERVTIFERYRPRLFGIAYRMLGSVEDARDLTQEAYLRWHQADVAAIRAPEGWLVAVITRLAIDRLRSATYERESYIGEWLPEPMATDAPSAPDSRAEMASDLSMAFLVMLERLAPEERAALLLRDVFDADYGEIARILEKNEAAARQMVHRARTRVRSDRARFTVAPETKEQLVARFITAIQSDDQDALLALVGDDASFTSDGGGRVQAVRNVLHGADHVVRFLLGIQRKYGAGLRNELAWINGEAAIATYTSEGLLCTTSIETDGERIVGFYRVLNPDKLRNATRVNR